MPLYPLPVALPCDERERLLSLYRDRVDTYVGVDAGYGQRWRSWCATLLSFGGSLVVPPVRPEFDLEELLASGSAFGSAVRCVQGDVGECHRNVAARWIDGAIESIGTGYALSADDLWRQHSWGVDPDGALVETTDERRAYVGIVLPARAPSMQFAGSNAQEHLKTVLRQRGPRAAELISMIRELASSGRSRS
ncbi:hypothetical protein ONA91_35770 [Micromonospora sp. DR5-3]|uniref:hypothetical protein n=1 Tax=unclassified Micromonospora TaxID=2617518 RepID=UPI0011D77828|nr:MULTISPECIES: hypothetical protein [unclassified Micromonospora]MCW3819808.1 hypothetical protein [Micromonospora sp. DR5-3]TYC12765.1 hypothetical protein FXF52_40090 [Micromonospora sp. MP36]